MKKAKSINEFIAKYPEDVQVILKKIRVIVQKAAPNAEETISYGIPTFDLNGSHLVYFSAFKNHIGFYPPAPKVLKKEVSQYEGPKGNLKFPLDKPIPFGLITKIVKLRVKEVEKNK